ncbi:DeoR family transcriptional regulator [Rhizobium sp. Root274]|uniref:DeoR/GlpR family DNA-binding transcription regulator n=1 Tax=unclassified Rhizobium TaxID=2613769 RepID=UPI0007124E30|nr:MULTISPECIES: DeoR/GlpR family DNA-binding transcription regulator [unclassified Rhizobium]KQW31288.1 DeoR family transcriptional regulator [Rhizobium sp. Root1240]KRD32833.1 DeoR family transcriptional regulator [Rhizobium sp. Root274]
MLTEQRRREILEVLKRDGRALAGELARLWDVSEDTIRRDMRDMAAAGLLVRVHGGALPVAAPLPDFSARQNLSTEEKRRLAAACVRLINPGQTVFLDGGTTTAEIARQIPIDMALTVVTHAPTIAAEFERHAQVEVILIGGRLFKHSMVAVGPTALSAIGRIRPDTFFVGATAAHPTEGLSTGDFEEAAIKRQIAKRSTATYCPLTAEKLGAVSPFGIVPLSEVTGLIVGAEAPEDVLAGYRAAGAEMIPA